MQFLTIDTETQVKHFLFICVSVFLFFKISKNYLFVLQLCILLYINFRPNIQTIFVFTTLFAAEFALLSIFSHWILIYRF